MRGRGSNSKDPSANPAGGNSEGDSAEFPAAPNNSERIAELFEAHNRSLLRFLTYRLHSSHEAKEIAQEAYVRMLQIDTPGGIGYLRAYLFKTAANLAADRLKSTARRARIDQLEFFTADAFAPAPESGVSAKQELNAILNVIDGLPARCRYAVVMHFFYEKSIPEVANLMNLSARMVQLYVKRALVFCRDQFAERNTPSKSRSGEQS
ncbi:MAG: RNA polymerase sigma factor [Steroidobacteraceae bacterium]